jgi:hypothetical protein
MNDAPNVSLFETIGFLVLIIFYLNAMQILNFRFIGVL